MLGLVIAAPVVSAEDSVEENLPETEQTEIQEPAGDKETPDTEEENTKNPQNGLIQDETQTDFKDELGISPEAVPEPVKQSSVKSPTINPVSPGATTISGEGLVGSSQRKRFNKDCIIHVTVKDAGGIEVETKTVSIPPKGGSSWSVTLENPVQAGYTVTAVQEFNGGTSDSETVTVQKSLADQYRDQIKMPVLEVWAENPWVIEKDAVDDIKNAFFEVNNALAPINEKNLQQNLYVNKGGYDTKQGIDVSGDGKEINLLFTDGSTIRLDVSDKVIVNQITETSTPPTINDLKVTANKITGKVDLTNVIDPTRLRVEIVTDFGETKPDDFCTDKGCSIDKGTKEFATVDPKTGEFSYTVNDSTLQLGKKFGVIVKEYRKKNSCIKTEPQVVIPVVEVRDPRKLTDDDKDKIREGIRNVNTVNGISKLPDGTGFNKGKLAIIDFDDKGNISIKSGNDGSVVATMKIDQIVKNKAPEAPGLKLDEDKNILTITPKEPDTDIKFVTIKYKDKNNADQTVTIQEGLPFTFNTSDVINGGTITVTVTDKGGIADGDGQEKESGQATITLSEKVKLTYNANGGSGDMEGVIQKKDTKYTLLENTFKAPDENQEFKTWKIDGKEVAPGTEITLDKDTEVKAIWKKIQVKVIYSPNGGSGSMTGAEVDKGSGYTVLPNAFKAPDENHEFKAWEVDGKEVAPGTEITVDKDTVVKAIWKSQKVKVKYDANGGTGTMEEKELDKGSKYNLLANGFTAPENKEFDTWEIDGKKVAPDEEITVNEDTTVKSIWKDIKVKVTYYANGGSGNMDGAELNKGSKYNLSANSFIAPENKEFAGWMIGDKEYSPEAEITVNEDTTVKAIWKSQKVKVKYDANGGTGTMEEKELYKGSKYNLLANGFTAPENKEFAGWKIGETEYAPEAEITVNEDTTVKAIWKDIKVKVTYDANGGGGEMKGAELTKGSKYILSSNRFTAPKNQEFKAWEVNGEEVAEGTEITVNKDTVVKAIWQDKKTDNPPVEEKVKVTYDPNGGSGKMTGAEVDKGSKYTVLPNGFIAPDENKEFKAWEVDGKEVAPGTAITVNENTVIKAIWKDKKTDNPPVEEKVKVTYDANGGSGNMDGAQLNKGSTYKLLANGFTAPENKEFAGWKIGENEYKPDAVITVNEDTTVKAIWKDKQTDNPPVEEKVKVTFNANEGTGKMDEQVLKKGSEYKLPENGFTAPDGKEFSHWMIGKEKKKPGDIITVNEDTEVKAIWKDKPTNPGSDNPGGDQPAPTPDPNPNPGTPGKPGDNIPGKPGDNTPGKPGDNTPGKPGDNTPSKPGDNTPGKPGNETPGTPGKEDSDKKPSGDKEKPNKPGEKDPVKPGVKVPGKDGKTNPDKPGIKIPGKDKPSESDKKDKKDSDASGTKTKNNPTNQGSIGTKKAGKNVKTGIGSGVGIVCTLVASTGALYISRKKED